MKNKIVLLLTVFSFLMCILYTPVNAFILEISADNASFATITNKSFFKNTVFKHNFKFNLDGFTDNIKAKQKNIDFSNNFVLMDKNTINLAKNRNISVQQKQIKQEIPANTYYSFDTIERWRMPAELSDTSLLFIFFILLYIGMLRSVYVFNRNKLYILYLKTSVC